MVLIERILSILVICGTSIQIGESNSCGPLSETYHLSLLKGVWPVSSIDDPNLRYDISLCAPLSYDSSPQKEKCADSAVCSISNGTATSLGKSIVSKQILSIVPIQSLETFNLFLAADPCGKEGEHARSVINFSCGETLGSPEPNVYGDCMAYFTWRTSAACKAPPKRKEVPCYVIDKEGNKIDLTDLIKSNGYYVQTADPSMEFIINVCTDIKDMPGKSCPANSSACRIINEETVSVGELKSGLLLSEEGPVLLYEAEENHGCTLKPTTKIIFRCPKRLQSQPPRLISKSSCQYEIEWETEFACPERMLMGNVKTCQFTKRDHGVQIDLSPLKKSTGQYHVPAVVNGMKVDFFLNVCGGLNNMLCNGSNWKSVSVCAQASDQEKSTQIIGSSGDSQLKYADGQIMLTYGKGKCLSGLNQATIINFICSEVEEGPKYVSVDECAHFFQWKTPHACEISPPDLSCIVQKGVKTINLMRLQKFGGRAWEILDGTESGENGHAASYFMNVCDSVSKLENLSECGEGTALCMIDKDGKYVSLGRFLSTPMYDANIDSVVLKYTNGSVCDSDKTWSSSIRFICLPGHLNTPVLMSVNKEKCLYEFEWRNAAACPLGHIEGSNCTIYDQSLGLNIDLSSLKSEVYDFETDSSKFRLGICESIPNPCSLGAAIQNVSVCQIDKKLSKSPALVIGNTNDKLSYVNGYINLTYQAAISTKPNQNFSVSIVFLCDNTAGKGKPMYLKNIEQSYEFRWYTDLVCEQSIGTSCIVHEPVSHNIYDLSSLSMLDKNWETTFTDKGVVKRLYINVCRRLVPGTECDHKASACITEYNQTTGETTVLNIGQVMENPHPRIDHYLQLNYSHGQPCNAYGVNTTYTTVVHFVCATDPSLDRGPRFIGWAGNCQVLFLWTTKAACPTGDIIVHNSCQLTDPTSGFNFNFASLRRETPYTVSSASRFFQLNVCGPVKGGCFKDDSQINAENVSVCEASSTGKLVSKLGSSNLFTLQYSKEKDLTMVYEGNDKGAPSAVVRFMCVNGTSEPNLHYVNEESNHVFFEMKTALACETEYFQCQFADPRGNDYDLSPLASNLGSNYVVGDSRSNHTGIRYHLNFCRPLHRIALYNCPGGATAACQINIHDHTGSGFSLGTQYHPPNISEDGVITIQYSNGSECGYGQFKRSVRINLFCSEIEGVLAFVGETPECEYIFSMNTQYACPLQSNRGSNCAVTDPVFGYRFNLSPLKNIPASVVVGDYKYFISVCGHLENVSQKCKDSAICQTKPSQPSFSKNLGLPNSNLTYNKGILALKYESGSANCHRQYVRTSVITFTCDHNATESTMPRFVTEAEDCTYVFEWPTMHACPPIHVVECSVEDDDGRIYDLSKLSLTNDNYYVKFASNKTFIINMCRSIVHTPDSICPYYSAACLYDQSNPKVMDRTVNIGDAKLGPYIENGQLRLKYSNGQPCKAPGSSSTARFYETIIDFTCDKDSLSEGLDYIGSDHCTYYFDWSTKYACPVTKAKSVGNCTVEDPVTGFRFNLTSLKRDTPYEVESLNNLFRINVCGSITGTECDTDAGVCHQEINGKKRHFNAGNSNSNLQLNDNVLYLNYSGGDMCRNGKYRKNTVIQFQCGVSDSPQPKLLFEVMDCTYYFSWTTKLACQYAVHCAVQNGSDHFDLSPLSAAGVGIARSDVYNDDAVYFINICGSLSNNKRIPCPPSASVCRVGLHNDTGEDLGTIAHPPFMGFDGHPTTIYNNGSSCAFNPLEQNRARVIYLCDPNQYLGSPVLIDIDESLCFYLFEWRTSLVCPSKAPDTPPTVASCMFTDVQRGIYFDLSSLRKNGSFYRVQGNEKEASYLLNVCDNVKSAGHDKCSNSSVCFEDHNTVDNYGTLSTQRFSYDGKRLRLTYTNGDDCVSGENGKLLSDIFFVCNPTAGIGQPQFHKKYPCSTVFMWETNIVCRNVQHQCIFDLDGSVFDLHLLSSMTHNWNVTDKNHNMYYINLCRGIMQDRGTSGCPPSSVVCMKTHNGIHMPLGMTYTVVATKKGPTDLLLTYDSQSNVPCKGLNLASNVTAITRIILSCGNSQGSPKLISGPDDQCYFNFSWKTNLVCPEQWKEMLIENDGMLYDKKMRFEMDLRNILNMTYVVNGDTSTEEYAYLVNLDGNFQNKSNHFKDCNSAAVCQIKPGSFFHRDIGSYSTRKFYVRGTELHLILHSLTKPCGKKPTRNVTTIIIMQCSKSQRMTSPEFLYETGGCDYIFYWETDAVCPNFNFTYVEKNITSDKMNAQNSSLTHSSHQTAIAMSLISVVTICLLVFILSKAERRASIASKFRVCFSRVSVPRFRYKRVNGERRVIMDVQQPKNSYLNDDDDNLLL